MKECPSKKAELLGATDGALVNMVTSALENNDGYLTVKLKLFTIYEPHYWIVDIEANVHVCADKSLFVSYQPVSGRTVMLGDLTIAEAKGEGCAELKFPSEKVLTLHKVRHVLTICRNILSGSILVKEGFRLFYKCNKFVILHLSTGVFYGKGYYVMLKIYLNFMLNMLTMHARMMIMFILSFIVLNLLIFGMNV